MNGNCVDKGWNNFQKWDRSDTVCNNFANLSDFLQHFVLSRLHSHTFPSTAMKVGKHISSRNKPLVISAKQVKTVGFFCICQTMFRSSYQKFQNHPLYSMYRGWFQHICYDNWCSLTKKYIYIMVCLNWPQVKLRSTETISLTASYSFFFFDTSNN